MSIARVDRAARVRRALVELVAEHGLHGAGMNAIARRAGVATGTAYVHYQSKEELLLEAYREVKRDLSQASVSATGLPGAPASRFAAIWKALYLHLAEDAAKARFLVQLEVSPLVKQAHSSAGDGDEDSLLTAAASPDIAPLLADLPLEVLFDLGFGPAIRLAAGGSRPSKKALDRIAAACWRAITRP
ncbi:MAG: TetR family transcriptional regulator [Actinobacteria bacterium]|nr:TetR family transcriptional regulator [Actinomycetota bacterium]